jgi:hypothetical protein
MAAFAALIIFWISFALLYLISIKLWILPIKSVRNPIFTAQLKSLEMTVWMVVVIAAISADEIILFKS